MAELCTRREESRYLLLSRPEELSDVELGGGQKSTLVKTRTMLSSGGEEAL